MRYQREVLTALNSSWSARYHAITLSGDVFRYPNTVSEVARFCRVVQSPQENIPGAPNASQDYFVNVNGEKHWNSIDLSRPYEQLDNIIHKTRLMEIREACPCSNIAVLLSVIDVADLAFGCGSAAVVSDVSFDVPFRRSAEEWKLQVMHDLLLKQGSIVTLERESWRLLAWKWSLKSIEPRTSLVTFKVEFKQLKRKITLPGKEEKSVSSEHELYNAKVCYLQALVRLFVAGCTNVLKRFSDRVAQVKVSQVVARNWAQGLLSAFLRKPVFFEELYRSAYISKVGFGYWT